MVITSLENDKIKYLKKLKEYKYIKEEGKFLIETENIIDEAIKNNYLLELILLDTYEDKYDSSIKKTIVNEKVMKHLTNMKSVPKVIGVSKLLNEKEIGNRVVVLDRVQDPGNAGTIVRNAVAFNIDTIIFTDDSVNIYNDKFLRSTEGNIFKINVIRKEKQELIKFLKEKKYKIVGTKMEADTEVSDYVKPEKFALVFGSEGSGLSKEMMDACDDFIKIEMNSNVESLNVSVSSGIILYFWRSL